MNQDNLSVFPNSYTCDCGYQRVDARDLTPGDHVCKPPLTPPRGVSMPQTQAHWEKRAETDQELILKMKDEISALKHTINQLRQK